MGDEKVADRPDVAPAVRVWCDGSGGLWAPVRVSRFNAVRAKVKAKEVLGMDGDAFVVMRPILGGTQGALFKALGPLLKGRAKKSMPPGFVPRFQQWERYLTQSQAREAMAKEEA